MSWTSEQILALAPDDASAKAGRGLASPRAWVSLGCDERTVWGECQGSGSKPYQVQIDLSEPALKCSCPSRKFPCKHGIGLFLLYADQRNGFSLASQPAWVSEWIAKRDTRVEAKANAEKPPVDTEKAEAAAQKRSENREARVTAGLDELDRWLRDLVRQGFAAAQSRPMKWWDNQAARMVDAQAPGLARMIREMAVLPASGDRWSERLLERVGLLSLLIQGYRRIESLPEPLQATVRAHVGWTTKQEDLLSNTGVTDRWLVLGQRVVEEDKLFVQRTWLVGRSTGRPALCLSFAVRGQPLDASLIVGAEMDAEVVYFPSAMPVRAIIKERLSTPIPISETPAGIDIERMCTIQAQALAQDPWLEWFPALLQITPVRSDSGPLALLDSLGMALPVKAPTGMEWALLALSGGRPISCFGEWNGRNFVPLSAVSEGRLVTLKHGTQG